MRYVSGPYTQGQLLKEITEIETSLTNRYLRNGVISDAAEQRSWRERVEDASFGRNTVMYDDANHPSVMVAVPCFPEVDVLTGAANKPHPAFIVGGVVNPFIYISKYQSAATGSGGTLRAYTLRGVDPGNTITYDNALLACSQKGTGWHLMSNAEWAAVALLCKARGFMPRGNNNYGNDAAVAAEKGVPSFVSSNLTARTATGTGPVAWSSDGSPFGVYDLNGNVYEWVGGLRANNGEIHVLPNNDAAINTKAQTLASAEWRAMLESGVLAHTKWVTGTAYGLNAVIAPGNGKTYICTTAGTSGASEPVWPESDTVSDGGAVWTYQAALTLKYDFVNAPVSNTAGRINTTTQANPSALYTYNTFETTATAAGVTVPNLMKLLALAPIDGSHGADGLYVNTNGERSALRGGYWNYASLAGVFCLSLNSARATTYSNIGFRSAFIP